MEPLINTVHQLLGVPDEMEKLLNILDNKTMASTPIDVKDFPNSYVFIINMPGLTNNDIKVQVEDGNVLKISGEQKRNEEEDVKFIRMERSVDKLMCKFTLPDNCNMEATSANCQDGLLTITLPKLPPPHPKKPKTIEVNVA